MADFSMYTQTVRALGFSGMSKLLLNRLFSLNNVFILQRSLLSAAAPNPHRMQFSISKIDEADWEDILREAHRLDIESRREIFARALHFRNDFTNCWAIRSKTGAIAHIQWIVFPGENDVILACYRNLFRPLAGCEVMIENAFTFPKYRGLGLFSHATRSLLNLGRQLGYKKAITYVRSEKVASLNELIRLGFSFKMVVREYRFLGFTRRTLEDRRFGKDNKAADQLNHLAGARSGEERKPEVAAD